MSIIFSGDVAFSGKPEEYEKAKELFNQVIEAAGLDPVQHKNRLFIVPGNHDLNRQIFDDKTWPDQLKKVWESEEEVQTWLTEESSRMSLLKSFNNFRDFVKNYTGQENSDYASMQKFDTGIDGKRVVLLGINSAWMAGRKNSEGKIDDYGKLIVGEPQIRELIKKIDSSGVNDDDLVIAILHHPLEWLREFDRKKVRMLLAEKSHFILCGHQHEPGFSQVQGLEGNYLIIPAGASYERREYPNNYNFVHLNFANQQGKIYLRRWSSQNSKWIRDDETYYEGEYTFRIPKKKDNLIPIQLTADDTHKLFEELLDRYEALNDWKEQHKSWQNLCTHVIRLKSSNPKKTSDISAFGASMESDEFLGFRGYWIKCKGDVKSLSSQFTVFFVKRINGRQEYSRIASRLAEKVKEIAQQVVDLNNSYSLIIKKIARENPIDITKEEIIRYRESLGYNISEDEKYELRINNLEFQDEQILEHFNDLKDRIASLELQENEIKDNECKIEKLYEVRPFSSMQQIAQMATKRMTIAPDNLRVLAESVNDLLQNIDEELQKSIKEFEMYLKEKANVR